MNKLNSFVSGITVMAMAVSSNAIADNSKVNSSDSPFYGALETRVTSFENEDSNTEVTRASLGAKGMYKYENFKAIYDVDVDFAPAANSQANTTVGPQSPFDSDDNFWVRKAVVILPTQYGTFVAGRGPSGNYLDVYRVLDLFKTNNWEPFSANQNMLFDQSGYGFNVFSYATPKFADGTLQAKVTNLTLDNNNGEDSDALGYRLLYSKAGLYAAISRVDIDRLVSTDYHRNTFAVSYQFGNAYIAGLYEMIEDNPGIGDQDNFGAVLSYKLNDTKLSLGYTERDADVDSADDSLLVVGARYQGFENLEFWVEAAATDSDGNDNVSGGITLNF